MFIAAVTMSLFSISKFLVAAMMRFGKLSEFKGTLALQEACMQESVGVCVCAWSALECLAPLVS